VCVRASTSRSRRRARMAALLWGPGKNEQGKGTTSEAARATERATAPASKLSQHGTKARTSTVSGRARPHLSGHGPKCRHRCREAEQDRRRIRIWRRGAEEAECGGATPPGGPSSSDGHRSSRRTTTASTDGLPASFPSSSSPTSAAAEMGRNSLVRLGLGLCTSGSYL
jgi:hypothetical protein